MGAMMEDNGFKPLLYSCKRKKWSEVKETNMN